MTFQRIRLFSISLALLAGFACEAQSLKMGKWTAEIEYADYKVPFQFEVLPSGTDVPEIIFINANERRSVKNARIEGDSIYIPLDPFDVVIKAQFGAMQMTGSYVKNYRNASMPFAARFGGVRFVKGSPVEAYDISKKWNMMFSPDTPYESAGVGLFKQFGEQVTGTVITETSDYRNFEGIVDGDSLMLSSFDGAHAFMILGKRIGVGNWEGLMIYDKNYSEPWRASEDANAAIEDPFEMVNVEEGVHKPYYDLLAAGSGKEAVDPSKYEGKVLLIQLFGTWCPNSHDQTKYLLKWYESNKNRGVEILASSYEANYSQEYGLQRLADYRRMNGISYDMVLGGRLSKTAAAMPFPFMERIKAFSDTGDFR